MRVGGSQWRLADASDDPQARVTTVGHWVLASGEGARGLAV